MSHPFEKSCHTGCNPRQGVNLWFLVICKKLSNQLQPTCLSKHLDPCPESCCVDQSLCKRQEVLMRILVICKKNVFQPDGPCFTTINNGKRTPNPKLNFRYLFSGISLVYLSLFGWCSVLGKVIFSSKSPALADFPAVFFQISHWYLSWNTIDKSKS